MTILATSRRRFLTILGTTPLAAKAAVDQAIGNAAGLRAINGIGNASVGHADYSEPTHSEAVPYEQRLVRTAEHVKLFGLPAWKEAELRDQARYVDALDPDLAAKRSWSMAVKIAEQRQRNYARAVQSFEIGATNVRHRALAKSLLGFAWPW